MTIVCCSKLAVPRRTLRGARQRGNGLSAGNTQGQPVKRQAIEELETNHDDGSTISGEQIDGDPTSLLSAWVGSREREGRPPTNPLTMLMILSYSQIPLRVHQGAMRGVAKAVTWRPGSAITNSSMSSGWARHGRRGLATEGQPKGGDSSLLAIGATGTIGLAFVGTVLVLGSFSRLT